MWCAPPSRYVRRVTSFRAEVSFDRIRPGLRHAYPASVANRIDTRLRYDVLFIEEPCGAVAIETDSGLLPAVLSAVERAGLTCSACLRALPALELPRHAARILSVNPTGGEIARLRDLARAA